jgi:hypothetical protein
VHVLSCFPLFSPFLLPLVFPSLALILSHFYD